MTKATCPGLLEVRKGLAKIVEIYGHSGVWELFDVSASLLKLSVLLVNISDNSELAGSR